MLIEKEIVGPGTYFYTDEKTGLPRSIDVTPEMCKYWRDQGSAMLDAGLTIPIPYEHDFNAHPMTPKDKLLNNAGWTAEYRIKDADDGRKNVLFGVLDIQDKEIAEKLPTTIRWTSPWINSFTDGQGKQWNNVISHIALTTRPRITKQSPFPSIAAALSMAERVTVHGAEPNGTGLDLRRLPEGGFCLSRAGKLIRRKSDKQILPRYPIAFSLFSGIALGDGDMPPKKKPPVPGKEGGDKPPEEGSSDKPDMSGMEEMDGSEVKPDGDPTNDSKIDLPPYGDPKGDVTMEELLCDLLGALGIHCEKTGSEEMFKRSLYTAAMTKIHELTNKAQSDKDQPQPGEIGKQFKGQPGTQQPGQQNPLIQQEQQPMYMSLEEITKISDPTMKTIALSMYNENVKLRAEVDASKKVTDSLRDAKLKEASAVRNTRVAMLSKLSPKVKTDLEAMLALPAMSLSMGDGGEVIDPMAQTLAVLEKGLSDMPRLLTTDSASLFAQPHPTDNDTALSIEAENEIVDSLARMMGCPPEKKAS